MKKRKIKKSVWVIFVVLVAFGLFVFVNKPVNKLSKRVAKDKIAKSLYSKYVKSDQDVAIYDKKKKVIGKISNIELILRDKTIGDDYYYAENIDAYVSIKDTQKIDGLTDVNVPTGYVPFNLEITLNPNTLLHVDENSYYQFDKEISLKPIKIDNDVYYFIYDNHLVYFNKDDIKNQRDISEFEYTKAIPVVNYHYVISLEADEKKDCLQSICLTDTQYDEQMKYLKDNDYYTASMEDLELWVDKKINLPVKTVVITIDDGWFLARNIQILEKYGLHATLFLIGSLASPDDYRSSSLEIHSHTWNMHNLGECPIKRGGAILCKDKNYILEDLKKSSESLNGSVYFAYPFYEYNDHAIEALKEAGFHMALAGGSRKVTQGTDKFTIPRYGVTNTDTLDDFIGYIS